MLSSRFAAGSSGAMASRSWRITVADSGRSSRSRSVALTTNPSRSAGIVGTTALGRGTRPDRCLYAMDMAVSPVNGSFPVRSS